MEPTYIPTGERAFSGDFSRAEKFNNGLALVEKDGKIGFIDVTGNFAIKPQYESGYSFKSGFAVVKLANGKLTAIDTDGKPVFKTPFDELLNFGNGYFFGKKDERKKTQVGLMDSKGEWIFTLSRTGLQVTQMSENLIRTLDIPKQKFGFLNIKGDWEIEPEFDDAGKFIDGLSLVRYGSIESGVYGFINTKGSIVINPKYIYAYNFSEGIARAAIFDENFPRSRAWGCINTTGEIQIKFNFPFGFHFNRDGRIGFGTKFRKETGPRLGYLDYSGQIAIEPQFAEILPFENGYASVCIRDTQNNSPSKWGLIDLNGKYVINPKFPQHINAYGDGLAITQNEDYSYYFIR
jgi:hypothetical protein